MRIMHRTNNSVKAAILLLSVSLLSACGTMSSPIDQAYSASGQNFNFAGGYTRTIFSTNNF